MEEMSCGPLTDTTLRAKQALRKELPADSSSGQVPNSFKSRREARSRPSRASEVKKHERAPVKAKIEGTQEQRTPEENAASLLEWVNRHTQPAGITVANFGASFRNGQALCALVLDLFPGEIVSEGLVGAGARECTNQALCVLARKGVSVSITADDITAAIPDAERNMQLIAGLFRVLHPPF